MPDPPVTLDFSKSQKLEPPPTLDFSKAEILHAHPPGFGTRLAQSLGIPTSMEELASTPTIKGIPIPKYSGLGAAISYGQNVYEHAKDLLAHPELGPALRAVMSLTPGGSSQQSFVEDVANQNYAGAAGTATGVAAQALAPELVERAGNLTPTKVTAPVRAAIKGANKGLTKTPGTLGAMAGAGIGGLFGGRLGAEILGGAGALLGRELLPQVRIPGEAVGLPNRVTGGPTVAPSYAETLGPVAGGPAIAPSYAESLGPVQGGPATAPSYAESLGPVKGGPRKAPSYEKFSGKLSDMSKSAVADTSTMDARLRSIAQNLEKEKAPAPEEEDLTAKGQKSVEVALDNRVLRFLKKQGEGLTVSMQQLAKAPEFSAFTPEDLQASAVRLRDAGKVWGHTARAAGEAAESIYGIASR